jgi:hypothetical protein
MFIGFSVEDRSYIGWETPETPQNQALSRGKTRLLAKEREKDGAFVLANSSVVKQRERESSQWRRESRR